MPRTYRQNVQIRTRGYLPHWEMPNAIYSVTYGLHDSLPQHVIYALNEERKAIKRLYGDGKTAIDRARIMFAFEHVFDRALDHGYGGAHLRDERIASIVVENLMHFEDRYELFAWCVMPTHVHVVLRVPDGRLAPIVQSWKSYTAKRANEVLGRTGPFWAREYYDRIVRDEGDMERTIAYVVNNPVKARLGDWPWIWRAGQRPAGLPAGGRRYFP